MAIGSEVLFISTEYVKRYTNISDSQLDEYFKPTLLATQETVMESYLGTDLYEKLKTEIAADTLTGVYETLHQKYVMKATLWQFIVNFYVDIETKIDNGGLVRRTSEDTTDAGGRALNNRRDQAKRFALSYTNKMVDFICANSSDYPEYSTNTGADVKPHNINFISVSNGAKTGNYLL